MNTSTLLLIVCLCCAVSHKGVTSSSTQAPNSKMTSVSNGISATSTDSTVKDTTGITRVTTGNTAAKHAVTTGAVITGAVTTPKPSSGSVPTWSKWGVLLLVAVFMV